MQFRCPCSALVLVALGFALAFSTPRRSDAQVFTFNSGAPDGLMATASRPGVGGKIEIESADDFLLSSQTRITTATFTGLLTGVNPTVNSVDVEIYRIFPLDSTTPPSGNVPTRTNSPSDNVFAVRDSTLSNSLTFTQTTLSASFTASNSVLNGINKIPNQMTGGEGAVTGVEVQFNLTFPTFLDLPADHYFFIPQVSVTNGEFYWLSTAKPISGAGTTPFVPDLQEWIRNANLDPDWLRVGTDIVGGVTPPTFNDSFSLSGTVVPEPSTWVTMIVGWGALVGAARLRRQRAARG